MSEGLCCYCCPTVAAVCVAWASPLAWGCTPVVAYLRHADCRGHVESRHALLRSRTGLRQSVVAPRRWSVRLVSSASAKRMAVGQTGIPMRHPLGTSCEWGYGGVARRWRESAVCGVGDGVDDGWRFGDALLRYGRGTKKQPPRASRDGCYAVMSLLTSWQELLLQEL